jgi:hypothetical protein
MQRIIGLLIFHLVSRLSKSAVYPIYSKEIATPVVLETPAFFSSPAKPKRGAEIRFLSTFGDPQKKAENGESELSSLNPIGTPSAFFA